MKLSLLRHPREIFDITSMVFIFSYGFILGVTETKKVEVYHCTSSTRNPFRWISVEASMNGYLHKYPLKSAVWYPHLKFSPSVARFRFSAFFVHFLPAIVLDFVTQIAGGRPM